MSAVILQNEIVHYEVLGRGKPIVFLHGWVGSWRYWIPAMQTASTSYRSYAIDFWGYGDTSKNPDRFLLADQVNLLKSFLEHLGIGRVAIIGHSLGGIVAQMYASRFPDSVDRMMIISTPSETVKTSPRLLSDSPLELAAWLLERSKNTDAVRIEVPKTHTEAIRSSINGLDPGQLVEQTTRLGIPTLFVHGTSDEALHLETNENLLDNMPEQVHLIYFEQSGHFPMLDEANKFNRLMVDFLALKPGETPANLQLKEEWKRRIR